MYRIGDIVYYYNVSGENYPWELKMYGRYIIFNCSFDNKGDMYYTVGVSERERQSWYREEDLITVHELRKHKLKKLDKV